MSTIEKTQNYDLTKYVGIKYPLFLNDHSHDMEIIDSLIKAINDNISDIQRVIDTVSTQNIDDLIARIMALEVKVDNNANLIQSLLTSLAGLTSEVGKNTNRIANLKTQLQTAQSDIEELKRCCNNVLTTLNNHGNRISANETAINNINTEINRIKENVLGNATDIRTLATQIANILETKQDKLIAGTGIRIEDNVISTSGSGGNIIGTYDNGNLILG